MIKVKNLRKSINLLTRLINEKQRAWILCSASKKQLINLIGFCWDLQRNMSKESAWPAMKPFFFMAQKNFFSAISGGFDIKGTHISKRASKTSRTAQTCC